MKKIIFNRVCRSGEGVRFLFLFTFFLFPHFLHAEASVPWMNEVKKLVSHGGIYVEDAKGKVLFEDAAQQDFMPASTLKVVTSLVALESLGRDYRFKTGVFLDAENNLYIKGYADPYLVSEELDALSGELRQKGLKQVKDIILDDSFFPALQVPGASSSLNPYDALNSALSANFNTIVIRKNKNGQIESAEAQTPMTELTRTLASKAKAGTDRINLAAHPEESLLYVGHLLKAFLEAQKIPVNGTIRKGKVGEETKLFLAHASSKNLAEVIQSMLKFSTNFIANQLFMTLGAGKYGVPATLEKGQKVVTEFLKTKVGLKNFYVEEGSGLSRKNQFSPLQMVQILRAFEKYKDLLPEKLEGIVAKTGTLSGVSCLMGYFDSPTHKTVRFAILLNQAAGNRERIAKILYKNLQ
ncbi:MAG: D-alanyl-D-alanine carboxypeptidase [Deltaproteobacteria bacterium]|nr:D-alanyl-D-alanine carboxypeptidase [Deltaproteobacteria bacterium]